MAGRGGRGAGGCASGSRSSGRARADTFPPPRRHLTSPHLLSPSTRLATTPLNATTQRGAHATEAETGPRTATQPHTRAHRRGRLAITARDGRHCTAPHRTPAPARRDPPPTGGEARAAVGKEQARGPPTAGGPADPSLLPPPTRGGHGGERKRGRLCYRLNLGHRNKTEGAQRRAGDPLPRKQKGALRGSLEKTFLSSPRAHRPRPPQRGQTSEPGTQRAETTPARRRERGGRLGAIPPSQASRT